jgi:hypothetical protein
MFSGALRVYSARVASYKKVDATSLLNHNSHLWRITSITPFSYFSLWSTCMHLLETSLVDAFLILVDDS